MHVYIIEPGTHVSYDCVNTNEGRGPGEMSEHLQILQLTHIIRTSL